MQSDQLGINLQNMQTVHVALCQKNPPNQKLDRRSKHFFQRRHTDFQKAQEKMLNITSYQRNANQNYNEISPHISQSSHYQKVYKQ